MIRKMTIIALPAATLAPGFAVAACDAVVCARIASKTPEFPAPLEAGDGTVTAILDRPQLGWEGADGRWVMRHEHNSARTVEPHEIAARFEDRSEIDMTNDDAADHPYVGLWVTEDNRVRHRLLPNGRYVEARGSREAAYEGRYEVTGDHIEYWDDAGFTADGDFIDGVLHHGGMILRRKD